MIQVHYKRGNAAESLPGSIAVIATEGTPTPSGESPSKHIHYLRAWAGFAYRIENGEATRQQAADGEDMGEFWLWLYKLASKHRPLWVVGHNVSYDITCLRIWERIEAGEIVFEMMDDANYQGEEGRVKGKVWRGALITNDPPTIVSCRTQSGRKLMFTDLLNWVNLPLNDIAEMAGLSAISPIGDSAGPDDVKLHCRTRCAVIMTAWNRIMTMVRQQCLGQFRATLAGQADHAWRHPKPECKLLPTASDTVRQIERDSYYGGRVHVHFSGQVFRPEIEGIASFQGRDQTLPAVYKGPIYHLDCNGCYGSVMRANPYPVQHSRTLYRPSVQDVKDLMQKYCLIARVEINSQLYPYPKRTNGDVTWRTGELITTLAGPELMEALVRENVAYVDRCEVYIADSPFDAFVDRLWRIRLMYHMASMNFESKLAKWMIACLHGKLAAWANRWEFISGELARDPWGTYSIRGPLTGRSTHYRSVGRQVQRLQDREECPNSMPAISAYVTAYARCLMARFRRDAGHHCTLYEDADSIHVTQEGFDRLLSAGHIDELELGKLKVQQIADTATYWGRRDYRLDDRVVKGGLHKERVQVARGEWQQCDFATLDRLLHSKPPKGPVAYDRIVCEKHELLGAFAGPDGWTEYLRS